MNNLLKQPPTSRGITFGFSVGGAALLLAILHAIAPEYAKPLVLTACYSVSLPGIVLQPKH